MNLTQAFLTQNDCYTGGRTIVPKGVMVHSTGVAQPDANVFLKTWNRPDYAACVHAFVSTEGVFQTLPWNRRGWHAGNAAEGKVSANNTHISFELCEPKGHTYDGGTMIGYDVAKSANYFAKIYRNAVELTAMLCTQYHLNPLADGVVLCHSEGHRRGIASNHADVMHWFPKHEKTMDDFRADVVHAMKGEDTMTPIEVETIVRQALASALPQAIAASLPQALSQAMAEQTAKITYRTLEDIPQWGRQTVDALLTSGALKGDEHGDLNLTQDLLRALVILGRV